jgi:hypothetical protein
MINFKANHKKVKFCMAISLLRNQNYSVEEAPSYEAQKKVT